MENFQNHVFRTHSHTHWAAEYIQIYPQPLPHGGGWQSYRPLVDDGTVLSPTRHGFNDFLFTGGGRVSTPL